MKYVTIGKDTDQDTGMQSPSHAVASGLLAVLNDSYPDHEFQLIKGTMYVDGDAQHPELSRIPPKVSYMLWSALMEIHLDGVGVTVFRRDHGNTKQIEEKALFQFTTGIEKKIDLRHPDSIQQLVSAVGNLIDGNTAGGDNEHADDSS